MEHWENKRVIILGAARQGTALAKFLISRGARVTLSDVRTSADLPEVQDDLADLPLEWALGEHPISLLDNADLICPSGGVPLDIPFLVEAIRRGISLSNDTQIFLELAPCKVIGITGSAGKTTTTSLVGKIAQRARTLPGSWLFGNRVWLGGNIGNPLITEVARINHKDLAILEISSFQLELVNKSPNVAAVLNITPNHLDRHGSMEAYRAAKKRILDYQSETDITVLGRDDPGSWSLHQFTHGKLLSFGFHQFPADDNGTYLAEKTIMLRHHGKVQSVMPVEDIRLRGAHNLANVLAACAIAAAADLPVAAMHQGVTDLTEVAHRLEYVRTWGGARWYNDSIATAPERAIAAIRSFDEPLVLLAGGRDKNLPWEDFAKLVSQRVDHLILFGEAANLIQAALGHEPDKQFSLHKCANLKDAVRMAADLVEDGDVVLLSPGGTSFDEFRDFEERGERYKEWVNELL